MRTPVLRALAGVTLVLPLAWASLPAAALSAPVPGDGELGPSGDVDPDRPPDGPAVRPEATPVRLMAFPVAGAVTYDATFGACRGTNCERRHMGVDVFAPKVRPLIAAQAGTVTWLRTDASGTAGNGVGITDAEGWRYLYLHVNNDTPGTDDGANPPEWRFAPGIAHGAFVHAGEVIGFVGDSGNAETTPPHVHFELRMPDRVTIDPYPSLLVADAARGRPQ